MRTIALAGADLRLSRLSFGTGSLHHLTSANARARILAAAFEHGFTHFDTSPYYGFGIAEAELGRALGGHRKQATVASKVGLYPAGGADQGTLGVWTRKVLGKAWPALSRPVVDWSVKVARASLDGSLKRLRRDRIDILFLHEPMHGALDADEFRAWLVQERTQGRIAAWGLAGPVSPMEKWLDERDSLASVLQVRDSFERREADALSRHGRDMQLTYGYLSAAGTSGRKACGPIVRAALVRNRTGSIIISTRDPGHLAELAAAARDDHDGCD